MYLHLQISFPCVLSPSSSYVAMWHKLECYGRQCYHRTFLECTQAQSAKDFASEYDLKVKVVTVVCCVACYKQPKFESDEL